jgi:hypothetical protein
MQACPSFYCVSKHQRLSIVSTIVAACGSHDAARQPDGRSFDTTVHAVESQFVLRQQCTHARTHTHFVLANY